MNNVRDRVFGIVHRTILSKPRTSALPPGITQAAAHVITGQILNHRMFCQHTSKITLPSEVKREIFRVSSALRRMTNKDANRGEDAAKCGARILRKLNKGRISAEQLRDGCGEYNSLCREKHDRSSPDAQVGRC